MTHICPACGKTWDCGCNREVKLLHIRTLGDHPAEMACSEHCAKQLRALMVFLGSMGFGR